MNNQCISQRADALKHRVRSGAEHLSLGSGTDPFEDCIFTLDLEMLLSASYMDAL